MCVIWAYCGCVSVENDGYDPDGDHTYYDEFSSIHIFSILISHPGGSGGVG